VDLISSSPGLEVRLKCFWVPSINEFKRYFFKILVFITNSNKFILLVLVWNVSTETLVADDVGRI
jgi:hypothetical protein